MYNTLCVLIRVCVCIKDASDIIIIIIITVLLCYARTVAWRIEHFLWCRRRTPCRQNARRKSHLRKAIYICVHIVCITITMIVIWWWQYYYYYYYYSRYCVVRLVWGSSGYAKAKVVRFKMQNINSVKRRAALRLHIHTVRLLKSRPSILCNNCNILMNIRLGSSEILCGLSVRVRRTA